MIYQVMLTGKTHATVHLPAGTLNYREAGPAGVATPPVVFVHGILVDGSLWSATAEALAGRGVRSYALDLPLGAHRIPLDSGADRSPRGVARLVLDFLEALDLEDVTLVGSDTGGAICQLVLDTDAARIGRVVLTNCDAFEKFPPPPVDRLFRVMRRPAGIRALLEPWRLRAVRHSALGFGLLTEAPDPVQTRAWIDPCLSSPEIRRDTAAFVRAVDPAELTAVSGRLGRFGGRAVMVWGAADRFFTLELAERLRDVFVDAEVVAIPGGLTFVALDHPARLADEIVAAPRHQGAPT